MKDIGHIYLSWRQGFGKGRHIVGVLKRNSFEGISFQYLKEKVAEATKEGFTPYTEFPEIDRIYKGENVLEVFGQRITKSGRSDITDFLEFWEIDAKYMDNKYYLLAHTQGLMATDNFEFLADYNPKPYLRFSTDLAGLSILKLKVDTVTQGDLLRYELEPENAFDKYAVKVFKGDLLIGYIKKIHCRVFHKYKGKLCVRVKAIDKNGILKRIFIRVSSCDC